MEDKLPPVSMENLQVGPRVGMVEDLDVKQLDVVLDQETIANATLCALHKGHSEEHNMCLADGVTNPTNPHHELQGIQIQKLSSIVFRIMINFCSYRT
jgi:hypothetical protein